MRSAERLHPNDRAPNGPGHSGPSIPYTSRKLTAKAPYWRFLSLQSYANLFISFLDRPKGVEYQ